MWIMEARSIKSSAAKVKVALRSVAVMVLSAMSAEATVSSSISPVEMAPVGRTTSAVPVPSVVNVCAVTALEP